MPDVDLHQATQEMNMSKFWFYRLPKNTPGIYRYGRALRVNVPILREWMRKRHSQTHAGSMSNEAPSTV